MSAQIISGKEIGTRMREEMALEVTKLKEQGITPGLAVVIVGENPASQVYVRNKEKACEQIGIYSEKHALPEETTTEELLSLVDQMNNDPKLHGILVQLPLPKQIDEQKVLEAISPSKDVDGFHPYNVGQLVIGNSPFPPCTPYGMIKMLEYSNIEITGKKAVIIGRSNIVGKPISLLLLQRHATVTICHSRTKDLGAVAREADILVAAAVVLDVGINRLDNGKLCGDVDFEAVKEVASYITPVPGGVGPMTITMLLYNTINSSKMGN